MSHTCSAALVRCMDFRLEAEVEKYLAAQNLVGDVDIISVAGAAKDINDDSFGGVVKGQLELSKNLHAIKTIILMNHTDCGGYGGRAAFDNDIGKEHAAHVEELGKAAANLHELCPDMKIKKVLANIDNEGVVSIEEIA